jgi:hypothetical protein
MWGRALLVSPFTNARECAICRAARGNLHRWFLPDSREAGLPVGNHADEPRRKLCTGFSKPKVALAGRQQLVVHANQITLRKAHLENGAADLFADNGRLRGTAGDPREVAACNIGACTLKTLRRRAPMKGSTRQAP